MYKGSWASVSKTHYSVLRTIYSLDCSNTDNFRRGGPPRLPSPAITTGPDSVVGGFNFHFWRSSLEARFSKQSATYFPRIGRNLNALAIRGDQSVGIQIKQLDGMAYCPAPPVATNKPSITGWRSIIKSPVGVSVYQQSLRFDQGRSPRLGKS